MTQIFVVNSGSSSIKYQLIDVETEVVALSGLIERIGEPGSSVADHEAGMRQVLATVGSTRQIVAVGHRVVHGGSIFDRATLVTAEVEARIDELAARLQRAAVKLFRPRRRAADQTGRKQQQSHAHAPIHGDKPRAGPPIIPKTRSRNSGPFGNILIRAAS